MPSIDKGKSRAINDSGWIIFAADEIDNAGEIAAWGVDGSGSRIGGVSLLAGVFPLRRRGLTESGGPGARGIYRCCGAARAGTLECPGLTMANITEGNQGNWLRVTQPIAVFWRV